VVLVSDVVRGGRPVTGLGFASVGRAAVGGLLDDRFAGRLLTAFDDPQVADGDELDPFAVWPRLMAGEKPGGHGERCVAVGCLDMALWDLAGKLADEPLHHLLARAAGPDVAAAAGAVAGAAAGRAVPVYAAGGYRYPDVDADADRRLLKDELRRFLDLGHTHVKIKIGAGALADDLRRIETAAGVVAPERIAVDAMNRWAPRDALAAAAALEPLGLWWWEDVCDPLDHATQAQVAARYPGPIAAGECLFSVQDARNLLRYGGLRPDRDRLVFDPVHCYGLPEYRRIVEDAEAVGWGRRAFWPHGGHLFGLHVAAGLGLGGAEVNPLAFQPLAGPPDGVQVRDGTLAPPDAPGVGFETRRTARALFERLR